MPVDRLELFEEKGDLTHLGQVNGAISYDELIQYYSSADLGVFASSCENMPNILLETMASGLPIACSSIGSMPEILENAGVYFDPESPEEIANALITIIKDHASRTKIARESFNLAKHYTWERCAKETFSFLA